MNGDLPNQQKASRFASPLISDRSPKRSRKSLEPDDMKNPTVIDVVADGDALLVVSSLSTSPDSSIGLRVSKAALSMVSSLLACSALEISSSV